MTMIDRTGDLPRLHPSRDSKLERLWSPRRQVYLQHEGVSFASPHHAEADSQDRFIRCQGRRDEPQDFPDLLS